MAMKRFPTPQKIVAAGARGVLADWKTSIKHGVGIKRAEQLYAAVAVSIGLTEGLAAPDEDAFLVLMSVFLPCRFGLRLAVFTPGCRKSSGPSLTICI